MTCEETRRLLSAEPRGTIVPHGLAACHHLDGCPACRRFWQSLQSVDQALAARPLATPAVPLTEPVMEAVRRHPRSVQIARPFSRAFCLVGAALTLCALVGGALLLHYWSAPYPRAGDGFPANLYVNSGWPSLASAWLSLQGEQLAQVVLAALAGLVITAAGVAAGLRASAREAHDVAIRYRRILPPR